jgi:FixJ family two-component response regulator
MSEAAATVFVVDDDISVRESLELLIGCAGWRPETFASGEAFLARERMCAPSCLVLDMGLPDLHGLDLQARLVDRPDLSIIFISGCRDVPMTVRAMKAGADEFLTKPFSEDVILSAIRHALDRSNAVLVEETQLGALRKRYGTLSPRERQVMARVAAGRLNKQVGADLGIHEITVKAHRGKVMRKMQAGSFADLVNMAMRLRLISSYPAGATRARAGASPALG